LDALVDMMKEPTVPVIMAANTKSTKIKDLAKVCKTIEFSKTPERELLMFVSHVLDSEKLSLSPSEKIDAVKSSTGDIRAALNSIQSRVAGYLTASKDHPEIEISEALNRYFVSSSREGAAEALANADSSFPDPRFEGMNPDTRRKDMIMAIYSSIISSLDNKSRGEDSDHSDRIAQMLDLISRADIIVGRSGMSREWHLLKYVTPILSYGLYNLSRNLAIKYNQYSMPWPLMGPLLAKGQTSRKIIAVAAPRVHMSRAEFGSLMLPYLLLELKMLAKELDLREFAIANFGDESVAQLLTKTMEKALK
jgi:replication factor C large subunit